MKMAIAAASVMLLTACTTRVHPAPDLGLDPVLSSGLKLINATPLGEPRIFFTDGITTIKTDYPRWTQVLIKKFSESIPLTRASSTPRTISFSIQSITCTGHYVPECSISLFLERSDGVRKLYNTEALSGYPLESALNRALDMAASTVSSDPSLIKFALE